MLATIWFTAAELSSTAADCCSMLLLRLRMLARIWLIVLTRLIQERENTEKRAISVFFNLNVRSMYFLSNLNGTRASSIIESQLMKKNIPNISETSFKYNRQPKYNSLLFFFLCYCKKNNKILYPLAFFYIL